MQVLDNLYYAKSHEWLRLDGESGTVGITDHAQHELTDVVYVELPQVRGGGYCGTAGVRSGVGESRQRHLFAGFGYNFGGE